MSWPSSSHGGGGCVERPRHVPGEEHQDAVAVAQQLVQVARGEDDGAALVAALLELAPEVDDRLDVEAAGGVLEEHQLGPGFDQGEQGPLLVAARQRLDRVGGRALDVELGDALLGDAAALLPVDEEARLWSG